MGIMKLVEFGFAYQDLIQMPLHEFIEYVTLLIQIREKEKNHMNEQKAKTPKPEQKPIGAIIPGRK